MLTLVRSSREGQTGGDPPKRRLTQSPRLSLTPAERARLRAAVRNLGRAYGSYGCLAEVMGVPKHSLEHAASTSRVSYKFAVLVARAAGTTVEALLAPPILADRCPHCGARKGVA